VSAMKAPSAPRALDRLDQRIVARLQADGRSSYREMARSFGVSEATIRWRVRRLLDSGLLTIVAIANPFQIGYKVVASIFMRITPGLLQHVIDEVVEWPEVLWAASCTGRADLYIHVACREHEDLWELLGARIPALGGIIETETLIELKVHKLHYVYPGVEEDS
jgi:Lrp/AsnC family transcriptional regulator for asnA, asnC and gidA